MLFFLTGLQFYKLNIEKKIFCVVKLIGYRHKNLPFFHNARVIIKFPTLFDEKVTIPVLKYHTFQPRARLLTERANILSSENAIVRLILKREKSFNKNNRDKGNCFSVKMKFANKPSAIFRANYLAEWQTC